MRMWGWGSCGLGIEDVGIEGWTTSKHRKDSEWDLGWKNEMVGEEVWRWEEIPDPWAIVLLE